MGFRFDSQQEGKALGDGMHLGESRLLKGRSLMGDDSTRSDVTGATRQAEEEEARASHVADRAPTSNETELADDAAQELRDSGKESTGAEHYEEMIERGANEKGEGRIL